MPLERIAGHATRRGLAKRDLAIDNPNLIDVGAFASAEDLRTVAVKLLHNIIDASLDGPAVEQALASARPLTRRA